MLMTLLTIFLVLTITLVLFRKFFLYSLGSVRPVFKRTFQASWERGSSLKTKPLEIKTFEMDILPIVDYFIFKSGKTITLLGTPDFLNRVNERPGEYVEKFILAKDWDIKNAVFQIVWIFYALKEQIFISLRNLSPKLLSQLLIFLFLPFDSLLNIIWKKFSERDELNKSGAQKNQELWMELVS